MTEEKNSPAYMEGKIDAIQTVISIVIRCLPNPALMNIHQFLKSDLANLAQEVPEETSYCAGQADILEPLIDAIDQILDDREGDWFSLVAATPEGYALEQRLRAERQTEQESP